MRRTAMSLILALLTSAIVVARSAPTEAAVCGAPGAPTTTVYLPNITKTLGGPTGWVTPFIVQNVGGAATTLEVSFYRFSDGELVACRSVPGLLPGTSFADIPNSDADLPDNSQFSVVVRSFGSDVVAVVNEHQGEAARAESLSYVGLTSGAMKVGLPWVAKSDGGWLTTFIVQNLGAAPATVSAAFVNEDGTKTASLTRTILPGRSAAVNPAVEPGLEDGVSYAAVFTADQPIGVVANAHNDAPTAVQPMAFSYNGAPLATTEAHVPWVVRNADGGRTTTVVVQNLGTSDASPQLTFRRIGGSEQAAVQMGSLRPGRAARYTLPAPAPACPVAGSSSCPREGEHSLTVSGGSFGVLAYTLGRGSVMGGTGSAGASNRVYLPNVTRTLGGPMGWTTPIAIQSAGATTATLRWYRFADGALSITQYVGSLTSGSSVKVDPRDVADLADGSQYAVVVDGNGLLRATVLELSTAGGDGAMAYDGFSATGTLSGAPVVTSISLTPATTGLTFGKTQQFTATVRDQLGNAVTGVPASWSITPATLGTISATGTFTAGNAAGSGSITAMITTVPGGTHTASASVTVTSETVTQGGITFAAHPTQRTDTFIEATISTADAQTVAAVVDGDVTQIEATYARSFAVRPKVYMFAATTTYTTGLETVLLIPRALAIEIGQNSAGVFSTYSTDKVAANWDEIRDSKPITTLRHELTHMMVHEIAKPTTAKPVPAWFDEGNARLEQFTAGGAKWFEMRERYTAASMAATNTAFAIADISDQKTWNARSGSAGLSQYAQASQLARLARDDLGVTGVTRILELIGQGQQFDAAYASVAGRPFSEFSSGAIARLRAIAPSYPGVATAPDEPTGKAGLSYILYGFMLNSVAGFDVLTQGGYYNLEKTRTINPYGVSFSWFGSAWPTDTYTLTATQGSARITVIAEKAFASGFEEIALAA